MGNGTRHTTGRGGQSGRVTVDTDGPFLIFLGSVVLFLTCSFVYVALKIVCKLRGRRAWPPED